MFQKYSLEVISHNNDSKNKSFRQYNVDGINTIGVFGNEPFEVRFKNNTYSKVLVKLSIDGTDVLTGSVANTEVNKDIWVVQGYGTLTLKAWPETNNGGAQLVFTNGANSVAVHTHGDLSSRGIIAAAVFEEGHVEPLRLNNHHYHWYYTNPIWFGGSDYTLGDSCGGLGIYMNNANVNGVYSSNAAPSGNFGASGSISCSTNVASQSAASCGSASQQAPTKELQSVAAVGAGEYVSQNISHTTGLIKPFFAESVRVRYLWWDDLKAKLSQGNYAAPHASGFPGDRPNMSLGSTPRLGAQRIVPHKQPEPVFARF